MACKTSKDIWQIAEIIEIIGREIEAREINLKNVAEKRRKMQVRSRSSWPHATTRAYIMKEGKPKRLVQCFVCKKEHFADKCEEVKDIKKRVEILTNVKRCLNCLRFGHSMATCYSKTRCNHCNGKHDAIVCSTTAKSEGQVYSEHQITM